MQTPKLEIRVVSLAHSAERRALVAANLADCPLPWAFLDASQPGDPVDPPQDPSAQASRFGRELTPGEAACYGSHMRALSEFDADPSLDWLLVMEDDVWLDPGFPYAELAAWLDGKSIGYLRLFAREWRHAYPRFRFGERQVLYLASDPYGAQGYLISRASAAAFRRHVTRMERPIDDEFGRFWENGLDNHLLFPFPLIERHMASTLNAARVATGRQRPRMTPKRVLVRVKDYFHKRAYLAWRLSPFAADRIRPRKH